MSVDSVEQYLKPSTWEKLIKNYVSNELIPSNWTCFSTSLIENLQSLLAKSHGVLRIHESPKLLAAAVMAFNRYPGCFKEIGVELEDRFKWKLVNETVVLCLKNLESIMANRSEMIEYPEEKLMEMEEAVFLTSTSSMDDAFIEKKEMVKDSEDVIIKWKEMLDKCGYSESEQELLDVLNDTFRHFPVKGNEKTYTKIYNWLRVIISRIFYFAVGNIMPNKTESTPIVRLFCENKDYIVMAHELVQTMKREKMNVSELENSMRQEPILKCFSFNELAQIIDKDDFKKLEFVKIPLQKLKIITSPIPTTYGEYCIPLTEVIADLEMDMIQQKKLFQMATEQDLPLIEKTFASVYDISSSCYFIELKEVDNLKQKWNDLFDSQFKEKIAKFQPKEIRKVNERRRFTVDDLKNELEYLNLTSAFPEIKDHAEEVYNRLKENRMLKTTRMVFCVYACQMECIRTRLAKSELSTVETTSESSSSDSSSESTESNEEIPSTSISSDSSESIPPPKETKEEKKKLKKLRRKEKISREEKEEKPKEKESNTCPKCFRSSEFSRKTNEKLRISKIECKSLKKKLDEKTRKEEENEQLIRELKEKLEQKEKKSRN
uniref:RING-type domain-containing protein n=1 Tax=Caenorhabditis tropicalis TaxID=1561998 RepID=A0A1I7UIU8_9PELO